MKSFSRCLFCFLGLLVLVIISANPAYAWWWNVYPGPDGEATRAHIQALIDWAHDGDVIYFNRGTYDFSAAPFSFPYENSGAVLIVDKSLTIKGAPGSIIVGAPAVIDPDTQLQKGIICFRIINSGANKDVTFDGLTFQTFMVGISALRTNEDPINVIYYSNLRNLVVRNCTFLDMKRNGIACAGVQGNVTICNNRIYGDRASSRFGFYADWYYEPGNLETQPDHTLVTITGNSISGFSVGGILSNRPSNWLIQGNTISNSANGISLGDGPKNGATIAYNTLSDIDGTGINIIGRSYLINGVMFQGVARKLKLTNNNLSNIGLYGIFIRGDVAYSNYIAYNNIRMTNADWGPAIYSTGHDEEYLFNVISGYGAPAVYLGGGDSTADGGGVWGANHEYFFANSVSNFTPNWAPWHYELDGYTHDNVVIGIRFENATYMDYGINNIFRFVYPYVYETVSTSLMRLAPSKIQDKPQKGAATI